MTECTPCAGLGGSATVATPGGMLCRMHGQSAERASGSPQPGPAAPGPGVGGARASGGADLTLREAQRTVDQWMASQGWGYWQPLAQLARMTEELGEVARLVNHLYGEKPKKVDEAEQDLGLELADLLYTMICLANSQNIDLQEALERALEKYRARDSQRYPRTGERGDGARAETMPGE